jgi:cystathionine gamma-synthase
MHQLLVEYRPGTAVLLGIVFHNTIHHLAEIAAPTGYKHFGPVDGAGIDAFESWLEAETKAGRTVSYVFVEFPSNPLLASADLHRLRKLVG